ncbi:MAG TPA: saccharopine dehydrogenase NADP-binding domain-containing protein [Kofleriaceae bacterium]|nr:saccharopine dehydrogenase NADP-binding domain-containing protein [Kofleriaceae bacterium]
MLMIYGAAGYTAQLVGRALARRGITGILAGRDAAALRACGVAGEIRTFALTDPTTIAAQLAGVRVVLNAAGRYRETAPPLVEACLARGVHYLDLAGEVEDHRRLAELAEPARAAGSLLLPGVGFGVVPTELAAVEAARRLGAPPQRLQIAYDTVGGASRGTLETVLREIHVAGVQRRAGALVETRPGARRVRLDFGDGPPVLVVTNPWRADLLSAAVALGVPEIETLASFPAVARFLMAWPRFAASRFGRWLVERAIASAPAGPSERERARGQSRIRVDASAGERAVTVIVHGPEAYDFTAETAAAVIARVLAGTAVRGFATPSQILDWDALLELDGVREVAA